MNQVLHMITRVERMRPLFEKIDWTDNQIYGLWLSQAYYIAKRSTAYLGLCLFHSDNYPEFQERCTKHISEETGHEKLILNDLKNLGINLMPELPETGSIYKTQHFQIAAVNPLSFIGYIFLLELLAPPYGPFIMDKVANKKAVSFLKVHAKADEDHIGEAKKLFDSLTDHEKQLAIANFEMTLESYQKMLLKIAEHSERFQDALI